ncbi:MAG TPA: FAD binding domain-containing protein [Candidatus Limnocylindrales bacterium]|nr:FAD binding domain-containing protein [Candidatus Limnocylindrales bacterium]
MLRLPEFEYHQPRSLKQATKALSDLGNDAMLVAGGTDVYPKMKRGQFTPRHLISLRSLRELNGIRLSKEGLWIGAGESLTAVSNHRLIAKHFPALAHAAESVSTPQLRNMGTIGGNVLVDTRCNYYDQTFFWRQAVGFCMKKDGDICLVAPGSAKCLAIASSDTSPVLLSLGTLAVMVSPRGERRVKLEDLYRDDGIDYSAKERDEILRGLFIPRESLGRRNVYLKLRRRGSFDFPILGVAATMKIDEHGVCRDVSVVLTAVASAPKVITEATILLQGKKVTPELVDAVADAAAKAAHPLDNADLDYWYRKRMAKVYTQRALAQVAGMETRSNGIVE